MPQEFNPQLTARTLVKNLHYSENHNNLDLNDIYVVWFCKTLQNWKALISTNAKDNAYYEVTHDGDKNRTYVDAYCKTSNAMFDHENELVDIKLSDHYHAGH